MWPLSFEKENLDKISKKAVMNPIVKIERCTTTIQNDNDEKQNDVDEKPPKINTMQNGTDEKQTDVDEKPPKVKIEHFPTTVTAKVKTARDDSLKQAEKLDNDASKIKAEHNDSHKEAEKLNNHPTKIKVEHKQDLIQKRVSSQKKETNNNIAIVKGTPSKTSFKECPALKNCPNLQRLLSGSSIATNDLVNSVQTGGLGSSRSTGGGSVSAAGRLVSPTGSSESPTGSSVSPTGSSVLTAGSSVSTAGSSVSTAGISVSPAGRSVSTAGSSMATGGLGSLAAVSNFNVDTKFSLGKEVKKELGEGRDERLHSKKSEEVKKESNQGGDEGLDSKRHMEIKKSEQVEDVIILPAMKKEDETVLEVSQSTMNEDPTILREGYKGSLNQNVNESSWNAADQTFPHLKGLKKIGKNNLPTDPMRGRVGTRIRGGLERNPSTMKVQGQQRINKAMYKKQLSDVKRRGMVHQFTGRGMAHQATGRGMAHQATGRGMAHQATGRGMADQSTGRGMLHQVTGRGMVHQVTGRGMVDQSTGRGMLHQFTGRGMTHQATGRWVVDQCTGRGVIDQSTERGMVHQATGRREGLATERGVVKGLNTDRGMVDDFSTDRGMVYPGLSTVRGIVGGFPIGTGMADPGLFTGQEMVDSPTRKASFLSNARRKRLPPGSGLAMIESEMEASKRFMFAPGNLREVPRKRSVGKMIAPMRGIGLSRIRGARKGQGNGKTLKTSNAGHQRIPGINGISSLDEGGSRKTHAFNLKQEVIEVVNLSDEDTSPDDGPHFSPNKSSTPVPHISPYVCVSTPALAKLTNCDVSVSRSLKKPQQLEMPPGFKLPPGISITRMPSSDTSNSDQKNLSTPERIVKVLSETVNRNTGPKKKVELNLSDSQINVMKELSLL